MPGERLGQVELESFATLGGNVSPCVLHLLQPIS